MPSFKRFSRQSAVLAAAALAVGGSAVHGQVDNVVTVVNRENATGTKAIASYGYDPLRDEMYISAFGATAPFSQPAFRKISGVSTANQTVTPVLSEGQLQTFYRVEADGTFNPDRGVLAPQQSSILLNPKAIGSAPAYSFAVIGDNGTTRAAASTTADPVVTKRYYQYNLGVPPTGGDGRDVFTTRITLANMQAAIGTTELSSNQGRQMAWSTDGQSYYFQDQSTVFGGLWKVSATPTATGTPPHAAWTPTRILADASFSPSEPAVVRVGSADRIYMRGSTESGNAGGLDYFTDTGNPATSTRTNAVSEQAFRDFFELPANQSASPGASMTSDAEGNVYFNNTSNATGFERRGLFRLDPQGRLVKVVSMKERQAVFAGTTNSNMNRQQVRMVNYTGSDGTVFQVPQVMYTETNASLVAGAMAFKPGDYNRDNKLGTDDLAMLKAAITVRGQFVAASTGKLKFDANANDSIDWKDVRIMQSFFDLGDGDVDLNGVVDFADFQLLQNNFGTTGKSYVQGDLTGDDAVTFADFQLLQNSFGFRSSVVGLNVNMAAFDAAAWDEFVATVPEPGSAAAVLALGAGLLVRRRRRRTA